MEHSHQVRLAAAGALLVALGGAAAPARAQEGRLPALVEQIAGATIYLGVGAEQGVLSSDTLSAYDGPDGKLLGRFRVLSVSSSRSVVEFAGAPFPVTRGMTLYVTARPLPEAAPVAEGRTPRPSGGRGPSLHGRLGLEMDGFRSTTQWLTDTLEQDTRWFATPAMALRAVVADLPGGWSLNTNLRAVYRYSDPTLITPEAAVYVYQASVAHASGASGVHAEMGRFFNPFVSLGGAWDGVLVHVGGTSGLGLGVAAGAEPNRGTQGFSTDLPKFAAFTTYRSGAGPVRYSTDVSFQQERPSDGRPVHTSAAWSQYLRGPRARFTSDLQVDRDPEGDRWVVSRLNASASLRIVGGLELHGRATRSEPYAFWQTSNFFPFRRDQGSVGLSIWGRAGGMTADVTANRVGDGAWSATYAGSFALTRTPLAGVGWSTAANYWTQGDFHSVYVASSLARAFGRAQSRAGYQFYRSSIGQSVQVSHTADLGLSFPLGGRLFADLRGRVQRGANLHAEGLFVGLWTSF